MLVFETDFFSMFDYYYYCLLLLNLLMLMVKKTIVIVFDCHCFLFPKNNFFKKQLISNIYFIDLTLCK